MTIRIILQLLAFLPPLAFAHSDEDAEYVVRYPVVSSDKSYRFSSDYFAQLLDLALQKSGHSYALETIQIPPFPASRNVKFLQEGRYDINWMHTNTEREKQVSPIRFPIFRGLGGWRLSFVREDDLRFNRDLTQAQWQALVAGQGENWPDTKIFRKNGYTVRTGFERSTLLNMLESGRVDYFPRGVFEIWDELDIAQAKKLRIEDSTAFVYPTAFYMFVRNEDTHLHQAIANGLETAYADGSVLKLFHKHYGEAIKRSNLAERNIIYLKNDALPPLTPLQDGRLWFSESEF